MINELIRDKADLIHYLTNKQIASSRPPDSVMVSTELRKKVLTDFEQVRFIYKGRSVSFEFKSIGGGVYLAIIGSSRTKDKAKNI